MQGTGAKPALSLIFGFALNATYGSRHPTRRKQERAAASTACLSSLRPVALTLSWLAGGAGARHNGPTRRVASRK